MRWDPMLKAAFAATICSPAIAQIAPTDRQILCANYQTQIDVLSAQLGHPPYWDDVQILRARTSLDKLVASRTILVRLTSRLNSAEQSAGNAEAFGRNSEANVWRRNAADIRAQIDSEKKKAKAWAADVGISCPGCTYSVMISKVQTAIDGAVAARRTAVEIQRQIVSFKTNMAATGCSG